MDCWTKKALVPFVTSHGDGFQKSHHSSSFRCFFTGLSNSDQSARWPCWPSRTQPSWRGKPGVAAPPRAPVPSSLGRPNPGGGWGSARRRDRSTRSTSAAAWTRGSWRTRRVSRIRRAEWRSWRSSSGEEVQFGAVPAGSRKETNSSGRRSFYFFTCTLPCSASHLQGKTTLADRGLCWDASALLTAVSCTRPSVISPVWAGQGTALSEIKCLLDTDFNCRRTENKKYFPFSHCADARYWCNFAHTTILTSVKTSNLINR